MYSTEKNKIEQQRAHFEQISSKYFESRQSKNHLLLKDLLWSFFFRDKTYLKANGARVLEPMCGYGEGEKIVVKYLGPNISYEGFDYSENLINIVKKLDPKMNVKQMDVTKFEATNEYDIVILLSGLHHVYEHTDQILKNIFNSLKKGGYLINFEPTYDNFLFKLISNKIYKRNPLFDHETERRFSLKELNDLYSSNSYSMVDQIYPGLISYILYYNPDAYPLLNLGSDKLVKFIFNMEKWCFRNFFGKKFSFATLSLLKKPDDY